jgi:hypothetical protein
VRSASGRPAAEHSQIEFRRTTVRRRTDHEEVIPNHSCLCLEAVEFERQQLTFLLGCWTKRCNFDDAPVEMLIREWSTKVWLSHGLKPENDNGPRTI